jgi:hypothetical protein
MADMLTKMNSSTQETWRFFQERASWKLIYDPEFVSAKKRVLRGLTILQDDTGQERTLHIEFPSKQSPDSEVLKFPIADDNDAWACVAKELAEWEVTMQDTEAKSDQYYQPQLLVA